MKLTEKQKRFADYYIETGNITEAAVKAGYSKKTARVIGQENLLKPAIKGYIDEKLEAMQDERTASAKEVLEFLTKSMRGEIKEEVVVVEGTGDGTSEARMIEKQIGLRDRIKSAELLGKRYRLFTDRVEVDGVVPVMIVGEDELEE
ncbi:terminase small subunit [Leptotrichia sp. oral taxon 223]|uniref:terminase small subunit n=1 Tax=Leptotrichia sp. oral taxon 223 TaxID=712363 RepID=UPI0015BFCB8B|nr:terminase small subunit [Leptotrichia sp. oral taxon 223]NWO20164.1 terminase small subunit [Leptotrichia sp. oral taxon 223]